MAPTLLPIQILSDTRLYKTLLIVPVGRYRARIESKTKKTNQWQLQNGQGIHVAAEFESVTRLHLIPRLEDVMAAPPPAKIQLTDVNGSTLADEFRLVPQTDYRVQLSQEDADGARAGLSSVRWKIRAWPRETLLGPAQQSEGFFDDVEDLTLPIHTGGQGRAELMIEAQFLDGRRTRNYQNYNVLVAGARSTQAVSLRLSLASLEDLETGTDLRIEILDDQGLYSEPVRGSVSLGESDDWVYLLEGPSLDLSTVTQGIAYREVSRLSGPRGLEVVIRATLTSTSLPSTLTSTLSLPMLVLDDLR
jgi:hypothetical protein